MREEIKEYFEKVKNRVTANPTYIAILRKRDKLANRIRNGLLAFCSVLSPFWTFFCTKKHDPDKTNETSQDVINSKKIDFFFVYLRLCMYLVTCYLSLQKNDNHSKSLH